MSVNALALVGPGQAPALNVLSPLAPTDLETLVDFVYPSNNVGAIRAEMERAFLKYLLASVLTPSSLTSTWLGNEAGKPLSAAGGMALYQSLSQAITTAVAQAKADILGGVGPAYDTLLELANTEITQGNTLASITLQLAQLATALAGMVRTDGSTPIVAPQPIVDATGLTHAATYGQVLAGVNFGFPSAQNVGQAGTYLMGTTRADVGSKQFLFTSLYTKLAATSGTLVSAALVSIGTNAPAYDNIVKSMSLNAFTVVGENIPLSFHAVDVPAGTGIYLNVKTAQVGGSSSYTFFGFGQYR